MSTEELATTEEKKKGSPTFVLTLELRTNPGQERQILIRMDCARQVYNACLCESLKRLRLMRESKAYKDASQMKRGKDRTIAFKDARNAFDYGESNIQCYAKQFKESWLGEHLNSVVIQVIASRAYNAVNDFAVGKGGKPRFKGKHQLPSVEGKRNDTGLKWAGVDHVAWDVRWRDDNGVKHNNLSIPAIIDPKDPTQVHGLQARVKYIRLIVRKIRRKERFFVQLACKGIPYQKPKNKMGKGVVGLDIGPSTIAIVGEEQARLELFCQPLANAQVKIRRLQRKMDRQRRANNPQNYNENGTVKEGANQWNNSKRYLRTRVKKA